MEGKIYQSLVPREEQYKEKELKEVGFKNLDKKVVIIKKDVLDRDKIKIVGYINVNGKEYEEDKKDADKEDPDLVVIQDTKFEILPKKHGSLMGYLPVEGEDNYIAVFHHNYLILLLFLFGLLLAGLLIGGVLLGGNKAPEEDKAPIVIADGKDYDGDISNGAIQKEDDVRYIEIPGYSGIYVSPESYVDLVNPETNHVYFKYTITEDDNILYESDYIEPGKKIEWKASDYIKGAGDHDLIFEVSTISVDTQEPCNGATFNVVATVSG